MYCSECGAKLADDANFCTKCGNPVERVEASVADRAAATALATEPIAAKAGEEKPASVASSDESLDCGADCVANEVAQAESSDSTDVSQGASAAAGDSASTVIASEGSSAVAADQAEPAFESASGTDSEPAIAQATGAPAASSGENLKAAGKGSLAKRLRKLPVIVLVAIAIATASAVAYAAYWTYTTCIAPEIERVQQMQQFQDNGEAGGNGEAGSGSQGQGDDGNGNNNADDASSENKFEGEARDAVNAYEEILAKTDAKNWNLPDAEQGEAPVEVPYSGEGSSEYKEYSPSQTKYAYADLSGDGVPELLLGAEVDGRMRVLSANAYYQENVCWLSNYFASNGYEILKDGRLAAETDEGFSYGEVLPMKEWQADSFRNWMGNGGEGWSLLYATNGYRKEGNKAVSIAYPNAGGYHDSPEAYISKEKKISAKQYKEAKKEFDEAPRVEIEWKSLPLDKATKDAADKRIAKKEAYLKSDKGRRETAEKGFAPILDQLKSELAAGGTIGKDNDLLMVPAESKKAKDLQYAYVDLNGDGTLELLVGTPMSEEGAVGSGSDSVLGIYAFCDAGIIAVDVSYQDRVRLIDGGKIVCSGEGEFGKSTMVGKLRSLDALVDKANVVDRSTCGAIGYVVDDYSALAGAKDYNLDKHGGPKNYHYVLNDMDKGKQTEVSKKKYESLIAEIPKTDASVKWEKLS